MKPCLALILLLAFQPANLVAAAQEKITYYVQLIRGTNTEQPPTPEAKPVGPKLAPKLCRVFAWTHYWEMNRQEVTLDRGKKTKIQLNPERFIDIEVTADSKRVVTVHSGGKKFETSRPVGETMTIIGGENDKETAWFIVVRRDKPVD